MCFIKSLGYVAIQNKKNTKTMSQQTWMLITGSLISLGILYKLMRVNKLVKQYTGRK